MKALRSLVFTGITLALAGSMMLNTGCGSGTGSKTDSSANKGGDDNTILGAGSSFDAPLFQKMFTEYGKNNGLTVNYQSVGSGAGVKNLTEKTVDFGASDATLNDEQSKAMGAPAVHIPITVAPIVLSYNLPDIKDTLQFTPDVLADIFMGKIKKWNDPKIQAINKGVKLPNLDIQIAHRADGSGSTNIFTTYLSKVSKQWDTTVGKGNTVTWPVGIGGKGNDGVAGTIKQTPGCIGYVELAYAILNNMAYAKVQNKAGNYITPCIASVTSAANITIPADGVISLTNTEAADGYPISGFSWIVLYKEQKYNNHSLDKVTKMVKLIQWMLHDGQQYSTGLNYAPLSANAVTVGDAILKTVTFDGKPVLQ